MYKVFPPAQTSLTMFDVRECILNGEKELAVQIYCEIFKVGVDQGKKAVEELERSIQNKNGLE